MNDAWWTDRVPYVQSAFFCEDVLTEEGGRQSFLRCVDRLILQVHDAEFASLEEVPGLSIPVVLALMVRWDPNEKPPTIVLRHGGTSDSSKRAPVDLSAAAEKPAISGLPQGANVAVQMELSQPHEGTNWITVELDGETAMMVPLTIEYKRS